MPSPPFRTCYRFLLAALLTITALVTPATAQRPETGASPLGEALGAVLTTIIIGGAFVLLAPEYADRTTQRIHEEPVETFLYGFAIGILTIVVLVVLFVSVIGIVVAIPLLIAILMVSELGYLAVGRTVTQSWGITLLVAMVLSAVVGGVPILGGLLGMVLSSFGLGSAYLEYRSDGRSDRGRRRTSDPL